ncbi:MAG: hypothetical protein BGO98_47885 [Myxococcales bacterium 68-20]|nr:MAG: hypothetical protein BGO98_47885 [Myxococcales bacterium 68-20]
MRSCPATSFGSKTSRVQRPGALLLVLLAACGGDPSRRSAEAPRAAEGNGAALEAPAPMSSASAMPSGAPSAGMTSGTPCIVVQGEYGGTTVSVEGVLIAATSTRGMSTPLALRLTGPRCVIGLPRASVLTEVAIATAGPDLRPFLDTRVRITGEAVGGASDLGGPAVVILAKDVARLEPKATEP